MNVLAVDLGLRTCGYIVSELKRNKINIIEEGQVKPDPKKDLPCKLHLIFTNLERTIAKHKPKALIAEKLYSHYRHPTTLGALAEVRGVVAFLSYQAGIDFFEYPPTRARKAMLGKGNVSSEQVKKMAENIVGRRFKSVHTADAFSLVFAFSHAEKFKNSIGLKKQ